MTSLDCASLDPARADQTLADTLEFQRTVRAAIAKLRDTGYSLAYVRGVLSMEHHYLHVEWPPGPERSDAQGPERVLPGTFTALLDDLEAPT